METMLRNGTIEIVGRADHYHTGDVVTLVAELKEEVDYEHWHWYTRTSENEEWEVVSGQESDHFEYKTTGESFEIMAVLYDDDHHTFAESEPIAIVIDDHENHDPHIWLDPVLAQEQVKVIRDAFIEADPDGKEVYEKMQKHLLMNCKHCMKNMRLHLKMLKSVSLSCNTKHLVTLLNDMI